MTLLEQLQTNKGGLIQLKTQLYRYGRGWDNNPGRICLILDVAADAPRTAAAETATARGANSTCRPTAAFLLIDGGPKWIWIAAEDVELL